MPIIQRLLLPGGSQGILSEISPGALPAKVAVLSNNLSYVAWFTQPYGVIFIPHGQDFTPPRPLPNDALLTPVQIEKFKTLCGYDEELTSTLYSGFKCGFLLHFRGACVAFFAKNFVSAQENPQIVSAKLFKECQADRLVGPFDHPPLSHFVYPL